MPSTAHSYIFVCAFLLFCVRILTFSYAHSYFFVCAFLLFRMRILTFSYAHSYFFLCAFLLFRERILTFSYAHSNFFVCAFLLFRVRILTFSYVHSYFFNIPSSILASLSVFVTYFIFAVSMFKYLGQFPCTSSTVSIPIYIHIYTWILGVVSKQLRLLHGRVKDSTTSVNSLNPQMSELVEDAVGS